MPKVQPVPVQKTSTAEKSALAPMWHVIVWNDPVNLMSYVVRVLQRVFGYPRDLATKLMREVHEQGKSLVATEEREQAELHVIQLHEHGLQATLERAEA
jgi:ATP-dependent Clp protease adaptor protein ClpS